MVGGGGGELSHLIITPHSLVKHTAAEDSVLSGRTIISRT